jgi:hypothetical protein
MRTINHIPLRGEASGINEADKKLPSPKPFPWYNILLVFSAVVGSFFGAGMLVNFLGQIFRAGFKFANAIFHLSNF